MARITAGLVNGKPFEAWDEGKGRIKILVAGHEPQHANAALLDESSEIAKAVSEAIKKRKVDKKARLLGYRVVVDRSFYATKGEDEEYVLVVRKPRPVTKRLALDLASAFSASWRKVKIVAVYRKAK